MVSSGYLQAVMLLLAVQLLCFRPSDAEQEAGTVIPAESKWFYLIYCIVFVAFAIIHSKRLLL